MAISDWPEQERPRERLLRLGAAALSDAELLSIFLRSGIKGKSAVDLGRQLCAQCGSLRRLLEAEADEFTSLPGIGTAKRAQLRAVLELARRALREEATARDLLSSPIVVRDWLRLKLAHLPHEIFVALWLDAQNRLLADEELFRGTLTQTAVYTREVVKRALARNAGAVIFAHNHPSGMAEASRADEVLTAALKQALALIDVKVLDHFIVAGNAPPWSFDEHGML